MRYGVPGNIKTTHKLPEYPSPARAPGEPAPRQRSGRQRVTSRSVNLAYTAARQAFAFRHRHEQGVLRLLGRDRLAWLNGLVTNDVLSGDRPYAAWLTPQGRMITDMFVVGNDDDTLLEVPAPLAAALAHRLDGLIFTEDVRSGRLGRRAAA